MAGLVQRTFCSNSARVRRRFRLGDALFPRQSCHQPALYRMKSRSPRVYAMVNSARDMPDGDAVAVNSVNTKYTADQFPTIVPFGGNSIL